MLNGDSPSNERKLHVIDYDSVNVQEQGSFTVLGRVRVSQLDDRLMPIPASDAEPADLFPKYCRDRLNAAMQ